MSSSVNVALVGISGYGGSYLNALLGSGAAATGGGGNANGQHNGYRVVGVVDPYANRCPRLPEIRDRGIPVHADLASLFANKSGVELTLMATPIHLHATHTCAALAQGSNVLCEKPLGATVDDAPRVAAAERRHGLFVAVGYQWSFSRAVQALKRDVMAGVLGKARRLRTLVMFPRPVSYYRRNNWAGRIATEWGEQVFDSPLNNATAHYLHNMLYILGAAREDSATPAWVQAELYRANDIENYDTAALRCRTECGAEVLFYTTHAAPERIGPVCRFEFERATVEFDHANGGAFVARFHDGTVRDYGQPEADRSEKIWQSIDAVRTGRTVACGPRAALSHTLCVTAAQKSPTAIGTFPEPLRCSGAVAGETMIWIDGLAETLSGCFESASLPSDAGHAWARPARRVEVTIADHQPRNTAAAPFAAYA